MITTSIKLGHIASADYISQGFDCDNRVPHLVAAAFNAIAEEQGLSATLNVETSSVDIDIEDLKQLPDEDEFESCFERWLGQAVQQIEKRWMDGEI